MTDVSRRDFLDHTTKTGLALAATAAFTARERTARADGDAPTPTPKVGAFTKSFQDRPIPEVCRLFREIGLDGLDLTVRPGGHIAPENAAAELPQAAAAAKDAGVELLFLTTSITDADPAAERLLAATAAVGVDRVKLGYYRYQPFGTLRKQLDDVRKRLAGLARLGKKHGVKPCVHIHSGTFLPSHGTQLYELLRDFDPAEIGAYVDPLHMAKEGGGDGWRQGLDLLAPWIALCSVKNCAWERGERDRHGQLCWHTRTVPVADGVCPIPDFVAALEQTGFTGPYSLHSEYKGRHSFEDLDTDECLEQTAADLKFFRALL